MSEIQNSSIFSLDDVDTEEMNNLIDNSITDFDEGDLVNGTVVKIERDEVLVDIGFKSEGVIPVRELSIRKDANPADLVALGDSIEALVLQKEDKDGRLVLSKKRAEYERAWNRIEEKFNAGENVEGEVIEVVKGGLILDIGLRGFLPASLVDLRRVKDLPTYLGTRIEARVIEMDRNRNNVVLSRRVVLEESRKEVLVDIGFKSEGVIPVRELSIRKDANPADLVALGDSIEALVLQKEDKDGRLGLSKKRAEYERAWNRIEEKFNAGENVEGAVIEVVKGGLILDIGLRGFLPASLVDLRRVKDLSSYLGTRIEARVIEMDRNRNNVVLSRRVVLEESRKAERSEILSNL